MENKTILILEDETPLLNAIIKKIESYGCKTVGVRSVSDAMEQLKKLGSVDAIWLDHYLLGKEDGLDFVNTLKSKDSQWKEIPIFVVSNTASADKVKAYIELGVDKYYTKADNRLEEIIEDIKSEIK